MKRTVFLFAALACVTTAARSQGREMKYSFDNTGQHYLKFTFLNQVWVRYNQNNPGSGVYGDPVDNQFDVGLRRTRMQFIAPVSDRVFFYAQFGMNNFNYLSARKTNVFFHDVTGEYALVKRNLSLGAGLTAWTGMSRYSAPSVSSILGIDAPLFAQATNDVNDLFLRKLSVYAKGKLGRLDYRLVLSNPMAVQNASSPPNSVIPGGASYSTLAPKLASHGYLMYQFFDEESNLTAYNIGTYLGEKRVFNIGAGFLHQQDAMSRLNPGDSALIRESMELFAADVFYDAPINREKGTAVSCYAGYFNYNFGKNYLRNLAPLNPANTVAPGTPTLNGAGNGCPSIGTGSIYYLQAGFLLPRRLLGENNGQLMPYAAFTYNDFTALNGGFVIYDAGVNYLIEGHRSKITLAWQNRPVISSVNLKEDSRKNAIILQYQISL